MTAHPQKSAQVVSEAYDPRAHRPYVERLLPEGPVPVLVIRVPARTRLQDPILLMPGSHNVLVILEEDASAVVTDRRDGGGDHLIRAYVGGAASLEYVCIASGGVSMRIQQAGEVDAGGAIAWRNVSLAGNLEQNLVSVCRGAAATSTIDWTFYARTTEKQKLSVRNIFNGREGSGEITMRGVAEEKAHVTCNGKIEIGLYGGGTDTYLTQEVLMLDPTSKVDAIPGLEIKTNDVKASHSATVARVTEEDLFYFAARGIPKAAARAMFVEGFVADLAQRISSVEAKKEALTLIQLKLQNPVAITSSRTTEAALAS